MKISNARHLVRICGALLLGMAVAGLPALGYADHGSFGGGGGGHSGGGGGHFGGGGGGHYGGGGGHYGGGGGHYGGGGHFFGGGHYTGGGRYYGGSRSGGAHYAAPHFGGYAGARYYGAPHFAGGAVGHTGGNFGAGRGFGPRGYRGDGVGFRGGFWGGRRGWVGGYWNGVFWPRCYFNPGFAWFLPVLPFGFATFWWGGIPYYYWNDLYYTYSPADNGYVVTEPPPVAGTDAGQAPDSSQYGGGADIYLYPRNGQSEDQTATDRYECHSWAVGQTGFDPTRGTGQSGSPEEYRRAMIACLDARGYSAR